MRFVFDAPATPSVAISGSDARFPVRRIFCVGRNYAAHAREMGGDPAREAPFFFSKPADAVVEGGVAIPYPSLTSNLHHEAELVVAIGRAGRDVAEGAALDHVWGYAIGNDLTRRDLQHEAKAKGRPWDLAKGFDRSAVIGPVHPVSAVGHVARGAIRCEVNGAVRQDGRLEDMIWSVPEVVAILSRAVALEAGDLIWTGTPDGVGPLVAGDVCVIRIEGLGEIRTEIAL